MYNISQSEAEYVLKNLDSFVKRFERVTRKKVTPGALQIIHEILTEAAFPNPEKEQTNER